MKRVRTEEQKQRFREYHREWERKRYAVNPRHRVFTPEQKARRRLYYLKNRHKQIAAINARRKANPLQRKKWEKTYYEKNREEIISKSVERVRKNPLKARARYARYRKRHPEAIARNWKKRIATGKLAEEMQRRRARQRETQVYNCSETVSLLRLMPFCQYCFTLFSKVPTIDHVIPLSRGGVHAPGNLVAACRPCNSSKGAKLLTEWDGRIEREAVA